MDYSGLDLEMPSLSPLLLQRLRNTLLNCDDFNSDSTLRGAFLDPRISLWRAKLPEETSTAARVSSVINYLSGRFNKAGENGLFLLVQVLRDFQHPDDSRYSTLEALAAELELLQRVAQEKAVAQRARDLAAQAEAQPDHSQPARAALQDWLALSPGNAEAADLLAQLTAQEAARRKMQEEAARKAREEAERKAKEEADRKAKEEADREAKAEADRKAKEEADRKAQAEADRKAKEEADRKAQAEAARQEKEEADRKAQAEAAARALRLTELCTHLQAAADRQGWPDVLRLAEQILALQPGDANATQWVAYAREQMRRVAVPPPPVIIASPVVAHLAAPEQATADRKVKTKAVQPNVLVWEKDGKEMVRVPAGEFLYGEKSDANRVLPEFWIDKTPVTNAEYARFIEATGHKPPEHWPKAGGLFSNKKKPPADKLNQPVANISWSDAVAYAKWAGKQLPDGTPRTLPEFWIDKTPVTNAEYARFVEATGHESPEHWQDRMPPADKLAHPVIYVSWHDAVAYAEWAEKRLPTEEEWEKAARGTDGCVYPWGATPPNEQLCNFDRNVKDTTPVGKYSTGGDSPYGCVDMAGNVWEWTASDWSATDKDKVVRGGPWGGSEWSVRTAFRFRYSPAYCIYDVGFRCLAVRQD